MALTGDEYVGEYEGHQLRLIRDNWVKTVTLFIDGQEISSASCALPHNILLKGVLEHNGAQHQIEAKSMVDRLIFTIDSIEVDGQPITLTKTK